MLKYFIFATFVMISFLKADEIWLFEQEFVRFGKKEVYETLKKEWNIELQKDFKEKNIQQPVLAVQDFDSSLYIYLTPILKYATLDVRSVQMESFETRIKRELALAFASTLNFRVSSLQIYLSACSYRPEGGNCSFSRLPYIHYQIFSLTPGSESLFEEHLKRLVFEQEIKKSALCWRVWKVTCGGDLPKYVICRFSETKQIPDSEEIQFVHQDLKEIVRRQHESRGLFRRDLSLMPNNGE